jgi:hypothetical protein
MKTIAITTAFAALVASAPAFANSRGIVTPADNAMTRSETLAIAAGGTAAVNGQRDRYGSRAGSSWMQPDANPRSSGMARRGR